MGRGTASRVQHVLMMQLQLLTVLGQLQAAAQSGAAASSALPLHSHACMQPLLPVLQRHHECPAAQVATVTFTLSACPPYMPHSWPPLCACSGIVSARLLRWLPRGAAVINAARGGHLVEEDLLAALDSGHVSWQSPLGRAASEEGWGGGCR